MFGRTAGLRGDQLKVERNDIAGAGNIYWHDYEDVTEQHVWDTVQIDLPPLRTAIQQEVTASRPPTGGVIGAVVRKSGRRNACQISRSCESISRPSQKAGLIQNVRRSDGTSRSRAVSRFIS
jgi:hypothetical protein